MNLLVKRKRFNFPSGEDNSNSNNRLHGYIDSVGIPSRCRTLIL
jgi:hypothetical protein